MVGRETTLNAWDAQFWMQIPLPLAEVGSRLNAAGADYLDRLLELLEDAVVLATALALARVTAHGISASLVAALYELLAQPSLGKRIALLSAIERNYPGTSGWDLDSSADDLLEVFRFVDRPPRKPRVHDALEALTTIRNDDAHRRLPTADRLEVGRVVELTVFKLVRRNRAFYQRLLFVDDVRLTPTGGTEIVARSLNGPISSSYRRGNWQSIAGTQVLPKRVYLGDSDLLIDASPFLVMRGERVFVIDQVRASGPILRHFYSRAPLEERLDDASLRWLAKSSAGGTPQSSRRPQRSDDATPARAISVRGVISRHRRWLGSAFLLGCAGLAAVIIGVAVLDSASSSNEGETVELPDSLPQLFTGAPVRWGSRVSDLEAARGEVPGFYLRECARPLVDMRAAPWPPEIPIPLRNHTSLAFHRELGLFEVMIYSGADSDELARAVAARLGPHHRVNGSRRFWEYPTGTPSVRVKVTGLPPDHEYGRSAIKIVQLPMSARYASELAALGCR